MVDVLYIIESQIQISRIRRINVLPDWFRKKSSNLILQWQMSKFHFFYFRFQFQAYFSVSKCIQYNTVQSWRRYIDLYNTVIRIKRQRVELNTTWYITACYLLTLLPLPYRSVCASIGTSSNKRRTVRHALSSVAIVVSLIPHFVCPDPARNLAV